MTNSNITKAITKTSKVTFARFDAIFDVLKGVFRMNINVVISDKTPFISTLHSILH